MVHARLRRFLVAAIAVAACDDEPEEHRPGACADPIPVTTADGVPTGWVECADGLTDVLEPAMCDPRPAGPACDGTDEFGISSCALDADCMARPDGRCVTEDAGGGFSSCSCVYGCTTTADCDEGEVCLCPNGGGQCVPATCAGPDDCDGGRCGLSIDTASCGAQPQLACRTAEDRCQSASGCGEFEDCVVFEGRRVCAGGEICGRPLKVDRIARQAALVASTDWSAAVCPASSHLDPADRAHLAARWSRIGALEHASVASFARFSLELMALGAPAELVDAAHRAGRDEIEHARLAFALASAYAGRPIGPGRFELAGVELRSDRRAIAASLIDEGCVGEILGAVEATAAARTAVDPVVAAAHARIAVDETEHALLAWRCLRWLVAEGLDVEWARSRLQDAIGDALRGPVPAEPHLPRLGAWSTAMRRRLYATAVRTVVEPLIAELG